MLKPDAHLDADGLKAFCKGQIAHFKVPRFIRFVSEYPMTVTGKIQKFVMRDRMVEELEGTSSEKTTNTEKQSSNEQGSEAVFKNLFKKEAKTNGQAEYPLTINGKNVAGADTLGVVNPATGEVFAMVSRANAEQAHEAIAAAENAFDDWSKNTNDGSAGKASGSGGCSQCTRGRDLARFNARAGQTTDGIPDGGRLYRSISAALCNPESGFRSRPG